ncbi:MAG: ATP-dependent DNA helicase [Patescibacteria group bacterium]
MNHNEEIILNKEQKEAVEHKEGPILIVAGAGTGKTRVITERIKYLISQKLAKPKEILAVTFTEKGAGEMLERVDKIMPLGYEEPWITTFHSFADRLLREEALEIGLDPRYKILTNSESYVLVRKNLFNFNLKYFLPLGNPTKFISALLTFFSRLQDENITCEEFGKWVAKTKDKNFDRWQELLNGYKAYQQLKIKESFMGFGDLILWTIKLFETRPQILAKYKKQFKYILVDEFQDTNFAQFKIIQMLAPSKDNPNLMVVGDDSQSIYKFRGAAISNILEFMEKYKNGKKVYLLKNYRSTQNILDMSYKLIKFNNPDTLEAKLGINKNLISQQKSAGIPPQILYTQTNEEEAEVVVEKIIELINTQKYSYKDFAILARANNHLDNFVTALKRYQLPYQIIGNRGLFNQPEVSQLIAFLRVCQDLSDNISLYSLLIGELLNYEHTQILKTLNIAKLKKQFLWEIVEKDEYFSFIVKEIKEAITTSKTLSVSAVLYNFIINTKYPERLIKQESLENTLKINNLNLFFSYVKNYEGKEGDTSITGFVYFLDTMLEAGENPAQAVLEDIDTVNLLTAHSSKGLEFPVVFMVNLTADRFPTRNRHDPIEIPESLIKETLPSGDYHIQEERRLFYVGMTRAKDFLYLTYGKNYGGVRDKKPSVFITELGLKPNPQITNQLPLFSAKKYETDILPQKQSAPFTPSFVSYSQLNTYNQCPLQYKYKYILKIPTKLNHAMTFGQSIHNTLRDFHNLEIKGHKMEDNNILKIFEKEFLPLGYESSKHKEQRYEQGRIALLNYAKCRKEKFGDPKFIEEKFKLRGFEVPLFGFIDRIDYKDGGYEIIDYKTGAAKDQKIVDKDEQLTIYALAAREKLKIIPKKLSLYFIEEDKRVDTKRTEGDLEKEKETVSKTIKEIKSSSFEPKIGIQCKYCAFNKICPSYKNYLNY